MVDTNGIGEGDDGARVWNGQDLRVLARKLERAISMEGMAAIRASDALRPSKAWMIDGQPGGWLYQFQFDERIPELRARRRFTVVGADEETLGIVTWDGVAEGGTVIHIETATMLHGGPDSWFIYRENGSLYDLMRKRLAELWPDRGHPNRPFVPDDVLIRALLSGVAGDQRGVCTDPDVTGLNAAQANAVRAALQQRVTFLWGPPGTGKTATVAAIVREFVRTGRTVLAVAYTNKAADMIADRVANALAEHEGFHEGLIQRVGRKVGSTVRRRWADRLLRFETIARLEREAVAPPHLDGPAIHRRVVKLRRIRELLRTSADARLRETLSMSIRSHDLLSRHARGETVSRDPRSGDLRGAQVVITTLHQLVTHDDLTTRKFHAVVVDEGSQAPLPLAIIAAAHAREAVIISGDPRQLPTPTQSASPVVRRVFGTDLFHESGVLWSGSSALVRLTEQYRMAPELCAFVSAFAYAGTLTSSRSVSRRGPSPIRRAMGPLLFFDSGPYGPLVSPGPNGSRTNPTHVRLIADIIDDLQSRGLLNRSMKTAVLTPYRAQVAALRRRFKGTGIDVQSIHRYQAAESGVIVLDLCDAPGMAPSPFMAANFDREDGARLLTVAVSRARECLVVVGDFQFLQNSGGRVVRRFVRALTSAASPMVIQSKAAG